MTSWKTNKSKIALDHQYWKVMEDAVTLPNGEQGTYWWVDNGDFSVVIPFVGENEVMLVRQYRYPIKQNSWEFCMGFIESGEKPAQAAARELEEETGLRPARIEPVGSAFNAGGLINQRFHVFAAYNFTEGKKQLESTEQGMIQQVFTLAEIKEMMRSGEITDSISIAALHMFELQQ